MSFDVRNWEDVAPDFSSTLIVGNGASISVNECFRYDQLLGAARAEGLIQPQYDQRFSYFGTEDFEQILRMLWHAFHINQALGITESKTNDAYSSIRAALIAVVRRHHVVYDDAFEYLDPIWQFMKRFRTVLSLNYDLLIYWAILRGNQQLGGRWFKDGFVQDAQFDDNWKQYRKPLGTSAVTMVFYPHGNLALATHFDGVEVKLSAPSTYLGDLRDYILEQWHAASVTPLFVSEGTSQQKLAAILRSRYLRTVYREVLADLGSDVAIFGWGIGEHDTHILSQIGSTVKRAAVSIYRGARPAHEIETECASKAALLHKHGVGDIRFFWADSSGCWTTA